MKSNLLTKSFLKMFGMILITTCMIGCLVACGGNKEETTTTIATENETKEQTETKTQEETKVQEETGADSSMRADLTAIQLSKLMGNGINLGNTMEAYGHKELGTKADISKYETFWGQPITTQEMIDSMKEAGFDSLRIPVAWTNGMDFESGDYTIRKELLDRVEEIVNYALKNDMYVMVNDHWDGSWWGMFGSAQQSTRDEAMKMYVSMWTQIAERFKSYSDYLIFESANEELGDRLNDVDICKDSGTLSKDECYEMANKINQKFVDTIRSTGGNNKERFLLIAGYNTDIESTCDDRFAMPTDTAKDKLLLSVHYYTPWSYCGSSSITKWGRVKDYEEQNRLLEKMTKFTKQGYGIVIGEYAVLIEDGTVKENMCDFYNNLLDNCDIYGYTPMLWDCNSVFNRIKMEFNDNDISDVFYFRSYQSQSSLTDEAIANKAKENMEKAIKAAPETFDSSIDIGNLDDATAWLMFTSSDWSLSYSVGDVYDPDNKSEGIVVTDAKITGEGTYTVGIDFTKTSVGFASGTTFSALAIANGELLYPGYVIDIKEILINGEPYALKGKPYTTSDDEKCTRVNLYNEWVTSIPEEIRTADKDTSNVKATIVDNGDLSHIETISITFDYKKNN